MCMTPSNDFPSRLQMGSSRNDNRLIAINMPIITSAQTRQLSFVTITLATILIYLLRRITNMLEKTM